MANSRIFHVRMQNIKKASVLDEVGHERDHDDDDDADDVFNGGLPSTKYHLERKMCASL